MAYNIFVFFLQCFCSVFNGVNIKTNLFCFV
nr:MAG TPA: hypothetical protein [Caudoviricetes sp.]